MTSDERCEAPWNFSWVIPKELAGSSCPQTVGNLTFLQQQDDILDICRHTSFAGIMALFHVLTFCYMPALGTDETLMFINATKATKALNCLLVHCLTGISHLVTLSSDHKPACINFPGITNTAIYVEEFEAPTLDDIKLFIGLCGFAKQNDEAIAVHCRAGRGRTGTMIACYFVHFLDMSPESAITRTRLMRPGSVETYAQEKAVFMYRDYLRAQNE